MAKHEAAIKWRDLQDKAKTFPLGRVYEAGDLFPATKRKVADDRIEELKGKGFILEIEDDEQEIKQAAETKEEPKKEAKKAKETEQPKE